MTMMAAFASSVEARGKAGTRPPSANPQTRGRPLTVAENVSACRPCAFLALGSHLLGLRGQNVGHRTRLPSSLSNAAGRRPKGAWGGISGPSKYQAQ
jgi:hypothetical protein